MQNCLEKLLEKTPEQFLAEFLAKRLQEFSEKSKIKIAAKTSDNISKGIHPKNPKIIQGDISD